MRSGRWGREPLGSFVEMEGTWSLSPSAKKGSTATWRRSRSRGTVPFLATVGRISRQPGQEQS